MEDVLDEGKILKRSFYISTNLHIKICGESLHRIIFSLGFIWLYVSRNSNVYQLKHVFPV